MKKTLIRIITGIFLVSLLVLCLHLGDIVFLLIFGAFFLITVREMDHLLKAMGKEIVITPASIFAGFFGIVYYLTSYNLSVVFAFGLLMVVAMVWVNDSGAYIGGSLFGKHKMWPRHSPGKTWEGTAFGVLVAAVFGLFVGPLMVPSVAWYHWLAIALICSVVGTLGDLVESMLKRSVGVKDSGNIMPGHGGFLDRFDSLLVIMPFVSIYIMIVL